MIPAAFDYYAPTNIDEALRLLSEAGDEAKLMAGGQSLLPVLKLRLAAPEVVIDLAKIDSLRGIRDEGDVLVIGAMTSHHEVAHSPLIAQHAALLGQATATIADPQVRHRGTFGGALVHADPAGDLPAPALALDAEFVIVGASGRRSVAAADFFLDIFTTAVGEDEILAEVRIPKYTDWGSAYEKFVRIAQQWSIVAVAAAVRVQAGMIADARVALTNMGSTPIRARGVEQALVGVPITESAIGAAMASIGDGTSPATDVNGDPEYRTHLAGVLARRAVMAAVQGH